MKIVASNNITVSNVNDGTITHTAYSKSADGTDGFTTVYQNLNLGDNTKTFVGADEVSSNLRGSIRIDPATQKTQDGDINYLTSKPTRDVFDWFRFYLIPDTPTPNMTKVAVKPNTKYTFSVLLKGTGQHTIYAYQNWTAPNTPWSFGINLTNDWKLYTFTVTSSNVIPDRNVQLFIRSNNGTEINLKYPKVEEGSIATPYMPSSSEVTTADWPKYIGNYTDFTQADSTNPSDYTWSLMRGNDGKDGADGTDGTSGIIVSSVAPTGPKNGQLWQDSSTTPQLVKKWTGSSWVIWELYAQNLKADSLSALTSILGDVTAGTYTSWNFSDTGALNYLNGVYLYDGHLRSISIENSTVTDSDKNLTSKSYLIRGSDMYGGKVTFFNNKITTSAKPNDLLKGSSFFSGSNQAAVLDSSRDSSGVSALDIKSDNVKISGYAYQTIPWTKMTGYSYYKVMFGRVNIKVDVTSGSSRDNIYLGNVPDQYKSPNGDMMLPAQAWSLGTNSDRHVQYNADGNFYLLNPEPNTPYTFEISYTL